LKKQSVILGMGLLVVCLLLSACTNAKVVPNTALPPNSLPASTSKPMPTATLEPTPTPATEILEERTCPEYTNDFFLDTTVRCFGFNDNNLFILGTEWYLGKELVAIEVAYAEEATNKMIATANQYIITKTEAAGWNMDDVNLATQSLSLGSEFQAFGTIWAGLRQAMGIRSSYMLDTYRSVHLLPSPTPPTTSQPGTAEGLPSFTPTPMAAPGIVFFGYVRDANGMGEDGVEIYRRYASYPGELVATTDLNGWYQSDFYPIPGDEMVTLYPFKTGITFDPEYYYWRHYYGYEGTQHDFLIRMH
jgi:hypothetical protein